MLFAWNLEAEEIDGYGIFYEWLRFIQNVSDQRSRSILLTPKWNCNNACRREKSHLADVVMNTNVLLHSLP